MIPADLFRRVRRLEIRTRGLVDSLFGGRYHTAFKGRGMVFSEVRPYGYADDVRAIDWNVSARTGETHVKVFEEEREQTVLLVVDVSGSTDVGSRERFKRDVAAEACALLAFSALRNGDRVGLVLFAGGVEHFVPPARTQRHGLRLVRDLYAWAPGDGRAAGGAAVAPSPPGTDVAGALAFARRVLRRRAVVVLVSDFVAPPFARALGALAARHDVVALHLVDGREGVLPLGVGLLTLTDAETGERVVVDAGDERTRAAFARAAVDRLAGVRTALAAAAVDRVELRPGEDVVPPLARFFEARRGARRPARTGQRAAA